MANIKNTSFFSRSLVELILFVRYAGVGIFNTVLGFSIILGAMYLGFSPIIANVIGYAAGFFSGFFLSKSIVFSSKKKIKDHLFKYVIAFFLSYSFNLIVLKVSLSYLSIDVFFAQLISAICYTSIMFLIMRNFVFKHNR